MQIVKYVDFFISSILSMLLYVYMIKNVFNANINKNKKTIILSLFFSSIFISLINTFNTDTFKILFTFPFVIIAIKKIFNENYNKTILYCIFTTIYTFVGELIVGIIFTTLPFNYTFISNNILGTTIGTIFVILFTIPLIFFKKIKKILNNIILSTNEKDNTIMLVFIIFAIGALTYQVSTNAGSNIKVIMSIVISIAFLTIIYMYYMENVKSKEMSKNYNELFNYLEKYEKELVEKRKIIHDYKNQLIVINGYAGNNKKLKEYMNELISEQKAISENSLISNIDKLPRGLKGLIYYKFSHIENIVIDLQVLNSLKNFDKLSPKLNRQVLKIIGILVDNAIEATSQEEEKYINIIFSIKKNVFEMKITNPCTLELKNSNIMSIGFSTKGKNRGYGLALVKDILNKEHDVTLDLNTSNGEFISKLRINIK